MLLILVVNNNNKSNHNKINHNSRNNDRLRNKNNIKESNIRKEEENLRIDLFNKTLVNQYLKFHKFK